MPLKMLLIHFKCKCLLAILVRPHKVSALYNVRTPLKCYHPNTMFVPIKMFVPLKMLVPLRLLVPLTILPLYSANFSTLADLICLIN